MLENLLTKIIRLALTLAVIGLAIALFFIGIIVFWYLLLIGTVLWVFRRLYLAWQTRNSGPIQAEGVEIIIHDESSTQTPPPRGRVIDHE
jgi:hypothetical protein